ncbi:ankyrin repeat-containing protein ITN1-like [Salvia splendens]|uniref:ankyrin repeat-containing protein ITN1-like n=1 Tax=Salvia splendens TaxID=180675 RepID=UPI001C2661FA|nr:ankyrin repeat-containing protein ITN1-like [Salvia splendens]
MHFMLANLKVVYVLSTPMPEAVENETLEQTRRRMKWENEDYICRGHILNRMSDSVFDVYQNVESAKELWDSLEAKYMAEDASSNIIDKLSPSWKDFKNNLKHKKEELNLAKLGSDFQIEQSIRYIEKGSVGNGKQSDSELSYHLNNHGESAIYLVAKAGLVERVSSFLEKCMDESRLNLLFESNFFIESEYMRDVKKGNKSHRQAVIEKKENKSPIKAAIERKDIGMYSIIMIPFHVCLLEETEQVNYLSALEGHVDVIRFLLQEFPQAEELLDMAGRNILHIAVHKGRYNVVNFVLKDPNLNSLINMKDVSGDTPLHIASKDNHPKIVSTLT